MKREAQENGVLIQNTPERTEYDAMRKAVPQKL